MAATGNIVKDAGEVYARLFDHRPVLQSEIKFFMREFQTKRNNKEEVNLKEVLKNIQQADTAADDIMCKGTPGTVDFSQLTET